MKKCTLLFAAALATAFSASAMDDIVVNAGDNISLFNAPISVSKTWTFDDGTLEGWTTIDADGDGYTWHNTADRNPPDISYEGRNVTQCMASSGCEYNWDTGKYYIPNNYLVSPIKVKATGDTYISFYVKPYVLVDERKDYIGVAVSTSGNTIASNFKTIAEWTFDKSVGAASPSQDKVKRNVVRRDYKDWTQYEVDLSEYAGQEIWVALRHFNYDGRNHYECFHHLLIDDITIGNVIFDGNVDWACNNPVIGMPASGSGPIEFAALNDISGFNAMAYITAKPSIWDGFSFWIKVKPMIGMANTIEDVNVKNGDAVKVSLDSMLGLVYHFNDDSSEGWTTIDADGDEYNWFNANEVGIDETDCMSSASYDQPSYMYLTPDNYLVSPTKMKASEDSYILFWAKARSSDYYNEHFGVAVSTAGNTNAADFKTIDEWTCNGNEWVAYGAELKEYAGQEIWVALRHFNCVDQYYLDVDDVTIGRVNINGVDFEWINDNPSIGLDASGTGNISFDAVNKTTEEQTAKITVCPYKDVAGGKAYGMPRSFNITVAPGGSGIAEITADADTDAVFYTISGVQVPADRLVPGIYLRRTAGKTDKVLVK